ncbi:uncharacterized protein LOC100905777 [Galendromus occidentalis]|uniref:Uncharacterized protein LOC100905777 n=1 Tax=Galendromus occidentalis TaxID=34638 RepID=A0AAJ7L6J2_9ACAR|nr:uncharacterized protein LOC100905777 [Galendromus occidentalis]
MGKKGNDTWKYRARIPRRNRSLSCAFTLESWRTLHVKPIGLEELVSYSSVGADFAADMDLLDPILSPTDRAETSCSRSNRSESRLVLARLLHRRRVSAPSLSDTVPDARFREHRLGKKRANMTMRLHEAAGAELWPSHDASHVGFSTSCDERQQSILHAEPSLITGNPSFRKTGPLNSGLDQCKVFVYAELGPPRPRISRLFRTRARTINRRSQPELPNSPRTGHDTPSHGLVSFLRCSSRKVRFSELLRLNLQLAPVEGDRQRAKSELRFDSISDRNVLRPHQRIGKRPLTTGGICEFVHGFTCNARGGIPSCQRIAFSRNRGCRASHIPFFRSASNSAPHTIQDATRNIRSPDPSEASLDGMYSDLRPG